MRSSPQPFIGWAPPARSMMLSRRKPRTSWKNPSSSGPRWASAEVMRWTSAPPPMTPAIPHIPSVGNPTSQIPNPNRQKRSFQLQDDGAQDVDQLGGFKDIRLHIHSRAPEVLNDLQPIASLSRLSTCNDEKSSLLGFGSRAVRFLDIGS